MVILLLDDSFYIKSNSESSVDEGSEQNKLDDNNDSILNDNNKAIVKRK